MVAAPNTPSRSAAHSSWHSRSSAGSSRAPTRPARTGLIVGLLAMLSLAAFWSGLPYVLGPAAIVLGLLGRTTSKSGAQGTIAVVLGVVATIAGLAAIVLDQTM